MHLKRELKEETPVYQIFFIVFKRIFMHLKRELKDSQDEAKRFADAFTHASKKRIERPTAVRTSASNALTTCI